MVELRHIFDSHKELDSYQKHHTSWWKPSVSLCKSAKNETESLFLFPFQVQNLIERCLQLYMNQKEVVETLLEQAKIEPGFTELGSLWSTLFFKEISIWLYNPCSLMVRLSGSVNLIKRYYISIYQFRTSIAKIMCEWLYCCLKTEILYIVWFKFHLVGLIGKNPVRKCVEHDIWEKMYCNEWQ